MESYKTSMNQYINKKYNKVNVYSTATDTAPVSLFSERNVLHHSQLRCLGVKPFHKINFACNYKSF